MQAGTAKHKQQKRHFSSSQNSLKIDAVFTRISNKQSDSSYRGYTQ